MTLQAYLNEVRERESKATKRKWRLNKTNKDYHDDDLNNEVLAGERDSVSEHVVVGGPIYTANAEFIAYMRNNTLRLVEIIEMQRKALTEIELMNGDAGDIAHTAARDCDRIASEGKG